MEFVRDKILRTISVTMIETIERMAAAFLNAESKVSVIPMTKAQYIVKVSEFEEMDAAGDVLGKSATPLERTTYMKMVGAILSVSGYRWDSVFATTYT